MYLYMYSGGSGAHLVPRFKVIYLIVCSLI